MDITENKRLSTVSSNTATKRAPSSYQKRIHKLYQEYLDKQEELTEVLLKDKMEK